MNLASCQLFEGFSKIQHERLSAMMEEIGVKKGGWLFREGSAAERLYCIQHGAVELLTRIEAHIELPITILRSEGCHFGTSCLVEPHTYSLSARAFEESRLWVIKRDRLMSLIARDPEMGFILMTNLATTFLNRLKETRQEVKIHFKTLFKIMRY
jgi:CRP-like cAMP-binding protein